MCEITDIRGRIMPEDDPLHDSDAPLSIPKSLERLTKSAVNICVHGDVGFSMILRKRLHKYKISEGFSRHFQENRLLPKVFDAC